MKLIIAGSRDLEVGPEFMRGVLAHFGLDPAIVVQGGAEGIDKCGKLYATFSRRACKEFTADWKAHGRAAGPLRNAEMAEYADALLLIWDGESRGSASMKQEATKRGKPVYEVILKVNHLKAVGG